jgi:hypothetical protein
MNYLVIKYLNLLTLLMFVMSKCFVEHFMLKQL